MPRVYRVDISLLSPEQKQEVNNKLKMVSALILNRMTPTGLLVAFDALEERQGDFEEVDRFKSTLGLPEQCAVIDVTGWDLRPYPAKVFWGRQGHNRT